MNRFATICILIFSISCSSSGSDPVGEPEKPTIIVDGVDCTDPGPPSSESPMRLMTRYEFDFTVSDLFGINANFGRATFPVENASEGFESTFEHGVSDALLRKLLEAAEQISPAAATQWDMTEVPIEDLLLRAFRRPITNEEELHYKAFYVGAEIDWGEKRAKEMLIESILLSPQFLYRIEFEDDRAEGDRVLNSDYEMASRLSYFLWGTMPDAELFDAASSGELQTIEQIETQVARMVQDDKARKLVYEFYRQYLGLNALQTMVKDAELYPEFSSGLVDDYVESTRRFVEAAHFEGDADVETLLTSDKLYLTPGLADLLGEEGEVVSKPDERAGLLTHPALMALLAYPDQTSPIHRGIFVRERILCQNLPSPPNDISIEPPEFDASVPTRERFEQLTQADFCTSCHVRIDPLGFGFENYDPLGRYRAEDGGIEVDGSGSLSFTQDPAVSGNFDGAVELSQRLADADEVKACIAQNWFRFAIGQRPSEGNFCEVKNTSESFAKTSGKFEDLMVTIATSETFRHRLLQGTGR